MTSLPTRARAFLFAMAFLSIAAAPRSAEAQQTDRVFELRTYTAVEGKLDAVIARFRDVTMELLAEYGAESVGYWTPLDPELSDNTLIYMLAHPSREAAAANWQAFFQDPRWIEARAKSEADGPILERVQSVFVEPTDFSPLH